MKAHFSADLSCKYIQLLDLIVVRSDVVQREFWTQQLQKFLVCVIDTEVVTKLLLATS